MSSSAPAPRQSGNAHKRLTIAILIAMGFGIALGAILNLLAVHAGDTLPVQWLLQYGVDGLFALVGKGFIALLKVLVVPLVFVSLVCGTASLEDIRKVGRVGARTLVFYLATTAIAITLAISAALLVKPGDGFNLTTSKDYAAEQAPALLDVLINIFPSNIVNAMAEGEMLQIIVFAILIGLAINLSAEPGRRVLSFFRDLNEVVLKLVWLVMLVAPFGVFALVTRTFATEGFAAILQLGQYFAVVLVVLVLHAVITYPALLKLLSGLNPILFMKKMWEVQVFAFSTASSNATIPVNLSNCEKRLGVDNSIASFTIPLGATINMDGTAIMQGVATVFIAQAYGIGLDLGDYLTVILTATLASIGTAGVPGVGIIMLSMVLTQVHLPSEGIALIIGIDRLLDMTRTAVNVTGDAAVSCIVAKSENELDEEVFYG